MAPAAPHPLRILLYCPAPKGDAGGVQRLVLDLGQTLSEAGHEVRLAWPDRADADNEIRLRLSADIHAGTRVFRDAGAAAMSLGRAMGVLRDFRPDVVNLHFVKGDALYFLLLRRLMHYRVVLSFHGSDFLFATDALRRALPRLVARADAVTAVSAALQERIVAEGRADPDHVTLIPNGVDTAYWAEGADASPPDAGPFRIVTAGRLVPVKNYDLLIAAVDRAARRSARRLSLTIAGDGELYETLRRQADAAQADIELVGHRTPDQLRRLLAGADLYVLSSRSEGMPLAVVEAMAAGLPVLATGVGGVPELVRDGQDGLIVPPDDPERLSDALLRLIEDDTLRQRLARSAADRAREFDARLCHARYRSVLERIAC
jgi:glycosyltransferase involved in cell wall biosynthesis